MRIRVNKGTNSIIIILLLIMHHLGYLKMLFYYLPFFEPTGTSPLQAIIIFFVMLCLIVINGIQVKKRMLFEILFLITIVIIGGINGVINNGVSEGVLIITFIKYSYVILAIPIYVLLKNHYIDIKMMVKALVILCFGAFFFRIILSYIWTYKGVEVFSNIVYEGAGKNWVRNGIRRINPPFLSLLFVPMSIYLLTTTERIKTKVFCILCLAIDIYYTIRVHAARAVLIYHIAVVIIMFICLNKSLITRMRNVIISFLGIVFMANMFFFKNLISSFSVNSSLGSSTMIRLMEVKYIVMELIKHPLLGKGMLESNKIYLSIGVGDTSDVGFLYSIYPLGVLMGVWYILVLTKGFLVYKKKKKEEKDLALLVLGMTCCILFTGFSIDCFFDIFAFAMPFYIAIVEYCDVNKPKFYYEEAA